MAFHGQDENRVQIEKNWVNVFITRWNTEKRVEKVMHSREFLTNFKMFYLAIKQMYQAFDTVFHLVMKHCVECLILLLKQNDFTRRNWGCKNEQFFIWFLNTHLTLISLVFSLWIIINELEKLNSQVVKNALKPSRYVTPLI